MFVAHNPPPGSRSCPGAKALTLTVSQRSPKQRHGESASGAHAIALIGPDSPPTKPAQAGLLRIVEGHSVPRTKL